MSERASLFMRQELGKALQGGLSAATGREPASTYQLERELSEFVLEVIQKNAPAIEALLAQMRRDK